METRDKVKYILEDIYDLERQVETFKHAKDELDKRNKDLEVAMREYLQSMEPNEIKLYDKVKVVKNYSKEPMDGFEVFENEVGTVIDIDSDYRYPYLIRFDKEVVENYSENQGRPLWEREQLELI